MEDNPFDYRRDGQVRTYTGDYELEYKAQKEAESNKRYEEEKRRSDRKWTKKSNDYTSANESSIPSGSFTESGFIEGIVAPIALFFWIPVCTYWMTDSFFYSGSGWIAAVCSIVLMILISRSARIVYFLFAVCAGVYILTVVPESSIAWPTWVQDSVIKDGTVTVGSGDTLSNIAKRVTGDPEQWTELHQYNYKAIGSDPRSLKQGQVIYLPPDW